MLSALEGFAVAQQTVALTLDEVQRIASSLDTPHDEAQQRGRSFGQLEPSGDMFGASGAGHAMADAHRVAHAVFRDTVAKVITQLEEFQAALQSSVALYQRRDGDARDALLAVHAPAAPPPVSLDAHEAKSITAAPLTAEQAAAAQPLAPTTAIPAEPPPPGPPVPSA